MTANPRFEYRFCMEEMIRVFSYLLSINLDQSRTAMLVVLTGHLKTRQEVTKDARGRLELGLGDFLAIHRTGRLVSEPLVDTTAAKGVFTRWSMHRVLEHARADWAQKLLVDISLEPCGVVPHRSKRLKPLNPLRFQSLQDSTRPRISSYEQRDRCGCEG
jgi:hypothetical protein